MIKYILMEYFDGQKKETYLQPLGWAVGGINLFKVKPEGTQYKQIPWHTKR